MNIRFEEERAAAINTINFESFTAFLYMNASDYIGIRDGKKTTLEDEVREVLRLAHIAYVESSVEHIDFYNRRMAFRAVEGSSEESKMKSKRLYKAAAKKLLFINSKCKEMTDGHGFISRKIEKDNLDQMISLCDAFEWCVAHFDLI